MHFKALSIAILGLGPLGAIAAGISRFQFRSVFQARQQDDAATGGNNDNDEQACNFSVLILS